MDKVTRSFSLTKTGIAFWAFLVTLGAMAQNIPPRPAIPEGTLRARVIWSTCQKAEYPEVARQAGAEGTVRLRAEISSTGRIDSAYVVLSGGHPLLDEATVVMLKTCSATPATYANQPTKSSILVDYEWRLAP